MNISLPWTKKESPSEGDRELISELREKVSDAKDSMHRRHRRWRKYDEYYEGIHLINKNIGTDHGLIDAPKSSRDRKPLNLIHATVEAIVPIIMDARPMWYVLSEMDNAIGMTLAEDVSGYLRGFWYWDDMDESHEEVVRDFVIYGTGAKRTRWDQFSRPLSSENEMVQLSSDEDGRAGITEHEGVNYAGDVTTEWIDPFRVFIDPAADSVGDARFVAIAVAITEEEFERQFPDKSVSDVDRENPSEYSRRERNESQSNLLHTGSRIEVWEVYHQWGEKMTIFTGDQVLWHGDNPTPGNRFPVTMYANSDRGGVLWGKSEVRDLISVNDFLNLINYRVARNQRFSGNQQMVTNDDSIDDVTNEPGKLHKVKPKVAGGEEGYIKWLNPPPLDTSVFTWMQMLLRLFDTLSGVHDVTESIKPEGITTGLAVGMMNEAAQRRVRLMISSISRALEKEGQIILEFMQNNYASDRFITYMNGEGMDTAEVTQGALRHAVLSNGNPMPFRVVVQHKGELPVNPAAMIDISRQLYLDGIVDQEEVLKQAKWPGRQEVMSRMAQAEQANVQGQMAAQQQAMGATEGPPPAPGEGQGAGEMNGAGPPGGASMSGQQRGANPMIQQIVQEFGEENAQAVLDVISTLAQDGPQGLSGEQKQFLMSLGQEGQERLQQIVRQIGRQ